MRAGVPSLVKMMRAIPEIKDISLTTNGLLLEKYALELKQAGLNRVNVSLDTLDADKFSRLTRGGSFEAVWNGILAAEDAGLLPIKLNAVVIRGMNDMEVPALARLSMDKPWSMRFIELMPVRNQVTWGEGFLPPEQAYVSIQEIMEMLAPLNLEVVEGRNGNGPAKTYRIPGAKGTIGFISPVGEKFCQDCNRLRLTADGNLRPCLLSDTEVSIRDALRSGQDVFPLIQKAVMLKPEGHELSSHIGPAGRCMMQIGG